jgi:predicted regulator of Ras-like GTPase activity (Roadblock/LC7/MglB family)
MSSSAPHIIGVVDTHRLQEIEARLRQLLSQHAGLRFACVGSVDGRVVAFVGDGGLSPQRLAAITSSSLGLGESFAREALRSRSLYGVVVAEHGAVVTVRVPSGSARYAVSLGADGSETLALLLRRALDTSAALAALLP